MAPTLYYNEASPAVRSVLLTQKALGIQLNLKQINLMAGDHKTSEFLKINPQHTIPTLEEEDGFSVWDSHAINAYLVGKYGKNDSLYPKDLKKRALVDQRLHFDSGILSATFLSIMRKILYKNVKNVSDEDKEKLTEAYDFLEFFLKGNDYFAGSEVTIADFSIITTLTACEIIFPLDTWKNRNLIAWISRMKKLPYFNEANEKGHNYFEVFMKSYLV